VNQDHNGEWVLVRVSYVRAFIAVLMAMSVVIMFCLALNALIPAPAMSFLRIIAGGVFGYYVGPYILRNMRPWYVEIIKVGSREDVQREMKRFRGGSSENDDNKR
jgi:hypothetical protein